MKHSADKIEIAAFDDLFGATVENGTEQVVMAKLEDLHPFRDHPFKVKDDDKMSETVESIQEHGVLVPGLARPCVSGGYELISGHRRKRGSELAGLAEMPVIVRDLSDDEAVIIMVDSNIQRENLDYSEKAFAFKMKFEAMKHQGSKSGSISTKEIGEEVGESGRQIQRYIRLTELSEELLTMVDEKKIAFIPAVELSYLNMEEQEMLLNKIKELNCYPSLAQASQLKQYSSSGELSSGVIDLVMKKDDKKPKKVSLATDKISKYFPEGTSNKEIESVIYELLEKWKEGGAE